MPRKEEEEEENIFFLGKENAEYVGPFPPLLPSRERTGLSDYSTLTTHF